MRLDQYLVLHHGLTRNKAQQLIIAGLVSIDSKVYTKVSYKVSEESFVTIAIDRRVQWVSRSAEKLAGFLEELCIFYESTCYYGESILKQVQGNSSDKEVQKPIQIYGANCLDIGSSTGGFTQVLLQFGAIHVDAVDVGTDQLHSSLRLHERVSSYEQTDIRDFAKIPHDHYDIIVCDASFISLSSIIESILSLSDIDTNLILLYKPQFEVGQEHLRKTGVPKDTKIVTKKMAEFEILL